MKINPKEVTLLVIDMQYDYYGAGGNAQQRGKSVDQMQALPARINDFANKLRGLGSRVVFTRFVYDPAKSPMNYKNMISDVNPDNVLCTVGTQGVALEGVIAQADEEIIDKYTYDAFTKTQLKNIIDSYQTKTVVVCGVQAEVCVLATALRAFSEGYDVKVASDLIGTYDDKLAVLEVLPSILRYSASVQTSDEIVALLDSS